MKISAIIIGIVCLQQMMFCQSENTIQQKTKQITITDLLADPTMKCYARKLSLLEMARRFPNLNPQTEHYALAEPESETFDYAAIFYSTVRSSQNFEPLKNLKWVISTE